jgi:hypothetical protein
MIGYLLPIHIFPLAQRLRRLYNAYSLAYYAYLESLQSICCFSLLCVVGREAPRRLAKWAKEFPDKREVRPVVAR